MCFFVYLIYRHTVAINWKRSLDETSFVNRETFVSKTSFVNSVLKVETN